MCRILWGKNHQDYYPRLVIPYYRKAARPCSGEDHKTVRTVQQLNKSLEEKGSLEVLKHRMYSHPLGMVEFWISCIKQVAPFEVLEFFLGPVFGNQ